MTRRQRNKRRHGGARRGMMVFVGTLVIAAFAVAVSVLGYVVGIAASAPSIDSLRPIDKGTTSIVYAANGKRLGFIENDELRQPVPSSRIPQVMKDATVAIEDERYYRHKGVDYEGVVRAAVRNIRSGRTVQGGSTITMQLVRSLYIEHPKRNFQRKIREAKLAEELENERSKDWILTNYINSVPYGTVGGQTAVGAQAASRVFFNKNVEELTLPEAALLAGLPQAPSLYNPFRDPRAATERRAKVIERMEAIGKITPAQAAAAKASPLGVKANRYYTERREAYFFDFVKEQLIDRYGISVVRRGGLKIYTTIDLAKQQHARAAMSAYTYEDGPAASIVSIDPRSGYIRAMASSRKYGNNQFNYAAQGHRQAGSAFKTMVLMAALRQGVDPQRTYYVSRPLDLDTEYGPWKVQTYEQTYRGSMNLVEATVRSDNTVYAQLDLDVGPEAVRDAARDMGIETQLDALPAEGLGGLRLGVTPLEMANAYATLAAGGVRHKPIAVKRVVFPDGKKEDVGDPKGVRVFSEGVAWEATKILIQNIQRGTGTRASIGCPAAGKTGTVDDFTDAWFIGYTPHLSTSVWYGYPNQKVSMPGVAGGTIPASIWSSYMGPAVGNDCADFKQPAKSARFEPFFGRYSRTGSRYDTDYTYSGRRYSDIYGRGKTRDRSTGTQGGTRSGGGYDPTYYEGRPQKGPSSGGGGDNDGGGGGGSSGGNDGGGGGGNRGGGPDGRGGGTWAGGARAPG